MDNYRVKVFIENIYYLANEQDIKISEIEDSCGLSKGYLSRLKKDQDIDLGISKVSLIADKLNVTIDLLYKFNLTYATRSEINILNFIYRISEKTEEQMLIWKKVNYSETIKYQDDIKFTIDKLIEIYGKNELKEMDIFTVEFISNKFLILLKRKNDKKFYSTYLFNGIKKEFYDLCSTTLERGYLYEGTLSSLYELINKLMNKPSIKAGAREMIDDFMNKF